MHYELPNWDVVTFTSSYVCFWMSSQACNNLGYALLKHTWSRWILGNIKLGETCTSTFGMQHRQHLARNNIVDPIDKTDKITICFNSMKKNGSRYWNRNPGGIERHFCLYLFMSVSCLCIIIKSTDTTKIETPRTSTAYKDVSEFNGNGISDYAGHAVNIVNPLKASTKSELMTNNR